MAIVAFRMKGDVHLSKWGPGQILKFAPVNFKRANFRAKKPFPYRQYFPHSTETAWC
jgi:hypothetical protein